MDFRGLFLPLGLLQVSCSVSCGRISCRRTARGGVPTGRVRRCYWGNPFVGRNTKPKPAVAGRERDAIDRLLRIGALALLSGALLFGVASLFHPPTVNPWDPTRSLVAATHGWWVVDHWALLISVLLVHFGLFAFHAGISGGRRSAKRAGWRSIALAFAVASLILWSGIFLFEVTGWPLLAEALTVPRSSPELMPVARALWATSLSLGYAAAFFLGLSILCWCLVLVGWTRLPVWFPRLGVIAGSVSAVVQPLALAFPRIALWLLIADAALVGLWFLAAAWVMWRAGNRRGARGGGRAEAKE